MIAMSEAGFPERRRAARHGADRRPMRAAVGDGRASRSCASTATAPGRKAAFRAIDTALPLIGAGQEPALRPSARGAGPGRSRPLGRRRRRWRSARGGAAVRRHAVSARERTAGRFDTPESRAALERRLDEAAVSDRRRDAAATLLGGHEATASALLRRRALRASASAALPRPAGGERRREGVSATRAAHRRSRDAPAAPGAGSPAGRASRRERS